MTTEKLYYNDSHLFDFEATVLDCRETEKGYHIEVIDNGPGQAAKPEGGDAQKRSVAIKNVNTRLEFYGIPPLKLVHNALGGITASLDTPKRIARKGRTE